MWECRSGSDTLNTAPYYMYDSMYKLVVVHFCKSKHQYHFKEVEREGPGGWRMKRIVQSIEQMSY